MTAKDPKETNEIAKDLRAILDSDSSEEVVHQFFADRIFGLGRGSSRRGERLVAGTVSKFPITPDRIPDFCCAVLNVQPSQTSSRISFIELKKPASPLFTGNRLMSKDLNDAWIECVETSRLMADNFRDYLRRLVKSLNARRLVEFDRFYQAQTDEQDSFFYDMQMPRINSVIVIGRRTSLDSEGLLRTRELSASTGGAIRVITYDTVLDWVSEVHKSDYEDSWSLFMRGWYW